MPDPNLFDPEFIRQTGQAVGAGLVIGTPAALVALVALLKRPGAFEGDEDGGEEGDCEE